MSRWIYTLTAFAALAGGAGVVESAAAAHRITDAHLATSAHFLMLVATAAIALAAFARAGTEGRTGLLSAATILLGGGILFCADLSMRAFAAHRLFAFAAPIGGSLMILGWFCAALTAFVCLARAKRK